MSKQPSIPASKPRLEPTATSTSPACKPSTIRLARSLISTDFAQMLQGYGLTTAAILYRLPDHPPLLQTYVWQDYDLHPRFLKLKAFLDFWTAKLEGPLYKVTVAHSGLVKPAEMRIVGVALKLN